MLNTVGLSTWSVRSASFELVKTKAVEMPPPASLSEDLSLSRVRLMATTTESIPT